MEKNNNNIIYALLGIAAVGGIAWYINKSNQLQRANQVVWPNISPYDERYDPPIIDQGPLSPDTNIPLYVVDTSENVNSSQDLRDSAKRNDETNMTFSSASANTNPTTSTTGRNVPASYQSGNVKINSLGSIPSFNI